MVFVRCDYSCFFVFLGLLIKKQEDLDEFKQLYKEKSDKAIVYYEAMRVLIHKFNKQELKAYLEQFEDIASALSQQDDAENNDLIEIYRLLAQEIKRELSSLDEWLKKASGTWSSWGFFCETIREIF